MSTRSSDLGPPAIAALLATAATIVTADLLVGASLLALLFVWVFLDEEDQPPVLRLALTFQWVQVTAAPLYFHLTSRRIPELDRADWRPMMWIGLGCVVTLAFGLRVGQRIAGSRATDAERGPSTNAALPTPILTGVYVALGIFSIVLPRFVYAFPDVSQAVWALGLVRYAALYLLFRRLVAPTLRPLPLAGVLAFEVVVGMTGFFAGFREAFMMAALALLEAFDHRRVAHWIGLGVLALALSVLGVIWTGIKHEYRREWNRQAFETSDAQKIERLNELTRSWLEGDSDRMLDGVDQMVARLWNGYYPALAIARVPAVLPHTDGAITLAAIKHLMTPRFLFPDKRALDSDSEMVRRYSGVWVAGDRQGTSIAFGYAGELYVDFGVPLLFLPLLVFGVALGVVHRVLRARIVNEEIAIGTITSVFWASLFLYERSWVRLLGITCTSVIVIGGLGLVIDRALARALKQSELPVRLVQLPPR